MKFICLISISLIFLITIIKSTEKKLFPKLPNIAFNSQKYTLVGNKGKGQFCVGSGRYSECKKPYRCFEGRCQGDLDFGQKCMWVAHGSMCKKPYQCYAGRCNGNLNLNQACEHKQGVSLCRAPYVCENQQMVLVSAKSQIIGDVHTIYNV